MKKWAYLIGLAIVAITTGCNTMYGDYDPAVEPELPWEMVSPESQGIRSADLSRMVEHIDSNKLSIHSIIIYKDGTIPFEAYFEPYEKNVSHNLKSTSKGVISALVGIALREGYIESLDESVLSYFPEYEVSDVEKSDITIRDLLTMSSGLKWNENDLNSMYTFFVSKRIVPRVLQQPLVTEPGSSFNYNTGLTHLLSVIISKASGMSTLEFAEEYLFGPLGIQNIQWDKDREGFHIGGSELFLTPRAMMKFGVMYLQDGMYSGRQVVPAKWVRESTTTQVEGSFHGAQIQYGYLWWLDIGNQLFTYLDNEKAFLAMGVHGQRILVHPELDTVVVITADQEDASQCDILIRDFILPAL
ncbi:MAG: serine hydrolase [Spirochaetes bacterium]|jgi:CubicO group peptidase (beta-lactamase class C family)|nr:serine hydrolase [Spirochaetota bacterium]